MRSGMGLLARLMGGAALLGAILLVNGGYVYRTQCPQVGGSIETDWTYRIYAVVPYLGYSRSGCEVHTATRIALDAIGVWKIHNAPSAVAAITTDHRGEYTAQQRAGMQANCVGKDKSASFCQCAMDELARRFTPADLSQISAVTRYDQLPADLAKRASDATKAITQGCH